MSEVADPAIAWFDFPGSAKGSDLAGVIARPIGDYDFYFYLFFATRRRLDPREAALSRLSVDVPMTPLRERIPRLGDPFAEESRVTKHRPVDVCLAEPANCGVCGGGHFRRSMCNDPVTGAGANALSRFTFSPLLRGETVGWQQGGGGGTIDGFHARVADGKTEAATRMPDRRLTIRFSSRKIRAANTNRRKEPTEGE